MQQLAVLEDGGGANASTATRGFTYDHAANVLTAATTAVDTQGSVGYQPASSESFTYNTRGLLLSASGSGGSSSRTKSTATTKYSDAAVMTQFGRWNPVERTPADIEADVGAAAWPGTVATGVIPAAGFVFVADAASIVSRGLR